MLKPEGWSAGRNLVYRLYREEGLRLRTKRPRRRKMAVHREARRQPQRPNEAWSLDFIHDELSNGKKFRALTVVDIFTREGLAIEVGHRLRGEHVVGVLNRLVRRRGAPKYLFADNGAEFTGQLVDLWAYHHGTRIDFSRPGKPTDNAFIESFNGSLRDECLNVHWFETLAEAQRLIEAWRIIIMRALLTWLLATKRQQNIFCRQSLRRRRRVKRQLKTDAGYGPPIPSASQAQKPYFREDHFSGADQIIGSQPNTDYKVSIPGPLSLGIPRIRHSLFSHLSYHSILSGCSSGLWPRILGEDQ